MERNVIIVQNKKLSSQTSRRKSYFDFLTNQSADRILLPSRWPIGWLKNIPDGGESSLHLLTVQNTTDNLEKQSQTPAKVFVRVWAPHDITRVRNSEISTSVAFSCCSDRDLRCPALIQAAVNVHSPTLLMVSISHTLADIFPEPALHSPVVSHTSPQVSTVFQPDAWRFSVETRWRKRWCVYVWLCMAAKTDPFSTLSLLTGRKLATADTLNRYSTHDGIKINYFVCFSSQLTHRLLLVFQALCFNLFYDNQSL